MLSTSSIATPHSTQQRRERTVAYVLFRLVLGVNLAGHGFIRILHSTSAFAAGMVTQMSGTPLPPPFVSLFGRATPWIELTLGSLLILGLLTRWTLTAAMLFMAALMLGITLKQDWPTAGLQLGYAFVIFVLMSLRADYDRSWTHLLKAVFRSA